MKRKNNATRRYACAVLAAAMLISMTGAAGYADSGGAMPPAQTEDGTADTVPPQIQSYPEPETGEGEEFVEDVPAADVPDAVPPAEGENPAETTEWPQTFETDEEAFETAEEGTEAGAKEQEDVYDSEDPLYGKRVSTPVTISSIPTSYEEARPRALAGGEILRRGVDVSVYQGSIDWNAVAASGVEFAIIRVGYRGVKEGGLAADSYYVRNLTGAKAAGLKVGAYFFSQAVTPDEAREEARYLINAVRNYSIDLPLVFDYEEVTRPDRRLKMEELDRQYKTDICSAFCGEVEAAGYQSMVYCNVTMLNRNVYRDSLGRLWLAHWTVQSDYGGGYEFWQFGLGYINGIPYEVDLDYWFDPDSASAPTPGDQGAGTPATPTPMPDVTPPPLTGTPFTDVKSTSWYAESVLWAYNKGIVEGMGDGSFAPGATASRGQMATLLYRFMGSPAVTGTAPFTDLKADYYKDAVNWASANKIVNGTSATTFEPNGKITREDLVTMLYRMSGSPAADGSLGNFSDSDSVHSYARNAMIWAVNKDILKGYEDNTIQPRTAATRAEVCALLMRYAGLM